MSQAQNPRDHQALVQSMLQRLKLQNPNIPIGQNAADGQNAQLEIADLQTTKNNNSSPVKGFEPSSKIKRDFTVNRNALEVESSSSSDKSKQHGNISTEQLFSPKPALDATTISHDTGYNFATFRTKKDTDEALNTGERAEQNQAENSSFMPKVYAWSPKTPEIQNNQVSFEGVFGATEQNTQAASNNQNTVNRKQRSSEKKARRWTQKIKEKWRERPGSFGKKGKDADTISLENSPQMLPLITQNINSPSNEEPGGNNTSAESTNHNRTQTSGGNDENVRSTNDFDLGLGSFSLLDEIVSGQEWGKFLNPSVTASIREEPSTETMDQTLTNHHSMLQCAGNNSWTIATNRETQDTDIAMTQESPESSFPVNFMEQSQIQTEPMDQCQSQSDMLITVNEPEPPQPSAEPQLINTVEYSSLRGRNSLSRKRQYHSSERIETLFHQTGNNGTDAADDGSVFLPDNHAMGNTEETSMNCSSTPTPCSPLRGVLKPTLSSESTKSMETASKKRRMEVTRHVRFSEEIITIEPPELGPYDSDSEEEAEEDEEDSLLEEDSEDQTTESVLFESMQPEQAAPARRPVLPAWIRALKRRNTGKKPR